MPTAKAFWLPIDPSDGATNAEGGWRATQRFGFAADPTNSLVDCLHLTTPGSGTLFAACSGKLSLRPPTDGRLGLDVSVVPSATPSSLPASVDLYLHPSPLVVWNRAAMQAEFSLGITGFLYRNIDTASLADALGKALDRARWPAAVFAPQDALALLVNRLADVWVVGGRAIGTASAEGAGVAGRLAGFGVLTELGVAGPGHVYDRLRNLVGDRPGKVDDFVRLAGDGQLIDPTQAWDSILKLAGSRPLPMSALEELRIERGLSSAEWRQLGDLQKGLWRRRLVRRLGDPASPANSEPPFKAELAYETNVFRLEAIVELYANFPDPWDPHLARKNPGDAGYRRVELTNPTGQEAKVAGFTVQLDGAPNLSADAANGFLRGSGATANGTRITLGKVAGLERLVIGDRLYLAAETQRGNRTFTIRRVHLGAAVSVEVDSAPTLDPVDATSAWQVNLGECFQYLFLAAGDRPSRLYPIVALDAGSGQVMLEFKPALSAPTSAWEITRAPAIVVIDPYGGRVAGAKAKLAGNVLQLDVTVQQLAKLNPHFDTIYLADDTAIGPPHDGGRASHAYRIVSRTGSTIGVDGTPVLGLAGSSWHIPAGLGGHRPTAKHNLTDEPTSEGFDHYDGAAFLVAPAIRRVGARVERIFDGRVSGPFAITSLTSRHHKQNPPDHQLLSSLLGNRRYSFRSVRSGSAFKNFSLKVTDAARYDGVEARFYFDTPVTADTKEAIRFHDGNEKGKPGTGSDGCLVHFTGFYQLRNALLSAQSSLELATTGRVSPSVERIARAPDRNSSQALWNNSAEVATAGWPNAVRGAVWLVRPDERSIP